MITIAVPHIPLLSLLFIREDSCQSAVKRFVNGRRKLLYRGSTRTTTRIVRRATTRPPAVPHIQLLSLLYIREHSCQFAVKRFVNGRRKLLYRGFTRTTTRIVHRATTRPPAAQHIQLLSLLFIREHSCQSAVKRFANGRRKLLYRGSTRTTTRTVRRATTRPPAVQHIPLLSLLFIREHSCPSAVKRFASGRRKRNPRGLARTTTCGRGCAFAELPPIGGEAHDGPAHVIAASTNTLRAGVDRRHIGGNRHTSRRAWTSCAPQRSSLITRWEWSG